MTEETLFHEALAKPSSERAAFLDAACSGQSHLRAAVEALLAAHEASGSLLDRPPADLGQTVDSDPGASDRGATGEHIPQLEDESLVPTTAHQPRADVEPGLAIACRYVLQQKIGEGGMGEVWVAKQTEPVKRKVALKLIKTGMDSKAVLTRFEQERQALAMMDHPNIARVLDGGLTPTGQPCFVMELVNGLPLNKFCDEMKLTPKQRLELFVPICQAVQHAHQKGIVHRDLKPANILITMIDAKPVPKVIDFGVAKATAGKLTDESMSTQFGAVVGTLEYMSPEQAGFSGEDIDTRADIYSLGVILYELLTGLRPIDAKRLKKAALTEMVRIIREEEPSKPSTRLSTDESLPSLAALRKTEPKKLMALLRGELDWVVMKCLEKQRERRYETANGLACDIQRYLADEVVEARPPNAGYRLKKFIRRHKGQVIAASLVLFALLAGVAGTTLALLEARRQERLARTEADDKEAEREKAVAIGNDLKKANAQLTHSQQEVLKSNDQMLTGVARSLLRPLAVQVQPNKPLPPLNEQEIEPLWELASTTEERLRLRFVEAALDEPVSTRRLKDRAEFAFHAAIGLDPIRRAHVEELLGKHLKVKEISPEEQENTALCLVKLGVRDRKLVRRTAAALLQAMTRATDSSALEHLAQEISALAARMVPQDGTRACSQAAATLTHAMASTTELKGLQTLAQGLSAVAARMDTKDAPALIQAMTKTTDRHQLWRMSEGLSGVAARMGKRSASEATATLIQAINKTTDPVAMNYFSQILSAVAAHINPKEAAEVCGQAAFTLSQAMAKPTELMEPVPPQGRPWHQSWMQCLSEGLSAVAARMDANEAAVLLIRAMTMKTADPHALRLLAEGLSRVAPRMDRKNANKVCEQAAATLIKAVAFQTDFQSTAEAQDVTLARGLSALAAQMDAKDAVVLLIRATTEMTDESALLFLSTALSAAATRMDEKSITEAVAIFTRAMTKMKQQFRLRYPEPDRRKDDNFLMIKTTHESRLSFLSNSLLAVSARMEPKDAATLTKAMTETTDPDALESLAVALSAAAGRMDAKSAAEAAAILTKALIKTLTIKTANRFESESLLELQNRLSNALRAVINQMDPKDASQTAVILTQSMTKTTDSYSFLSNSLSVAAGRMDAQSAPEFAAMLTQAMSKTTDQGTLLSFANTLSYLTGRMDMNDAAQSCRQAASILIQAMTMTSHEGALQAFAGVLWNLADRMDMNDAAQSRRQAAAIFAQAMSKTTNPYDLNSLASTLSRRATRMDAKSSSEAAASLIQAMTKMTDAILTKAMNKTIDPAILSSTFYELANTLLVVAGRMDIKDATQSCRQAAAIFTQAMSKTTDPDALAELAMVLSAMAPRMDAKLSSEAAAVLTQTMTKTTDPDTLSSLAWALSATAARMEQKDAAQSCRQAAAILTQTMTKTTDPDGLASLAEALSALAARMEQKDAAQSCRQAAAILTNDIIRTTDPSSLSCMSNALWSLAAHMEPQHAVQTRRQAYASFCQAIIADGPDGSAVNSQIDPKEEWTLTPGGNSVRVTAPKDALTAQIDPKDAVVVLIQAMNKTTDPRVLEVLAEKLSTVAHRMGPMDAAQARGLAVGAFMQAMTKTTDPNTLQRLSKGLSKILLSTETRQRLLGLTAAVGASAGPVPPFTLFARTQLALKPVPALPQTLVDVLKHPFCVGEARRAVLEQLSRHYNRPFADQWELVEYVTENKLPLDLTTPLMRPK